MAQNDENQLFGPAGSLEDVGYESNDSLISPKESWHEQGMTGPDLTLPYFDGRSTNPLDHLIDLDTDSMETAPDVRVYFWSVGASICEDDWKGPKESESREEYDARMVRNGREYLKDLKDRGIGWFLSPDREDLLAHNAPDSDWYGFPTCGICYDFGEGLRDPLPDEGKFFNKGDHASPLSMHIGTNIRVPLWWADALKAGVVPGTDGWDLAIQDVYGDLGQHPGWRTYFHEDREEVFRDLIRTGGDAVHHDKAEQILEERWPRIVKHFELPDVDLSDLLALQGITADQFLGRSEWPKPYSYPESS